MRSVLRTAGLVAGLLAPLSAQGRDDAAIFRDFTSAFRLRVVCSQQHFGRLDDLVVELPAGRIAGAVVSMVVERRTQTVLVPWADLSYEPRGNVLLLADCLDKEAKYPAFDPASVKVTTKPGADGAPPEFTGTVLASRLQHGRVTLQQGAPASAQGLTFELVSGHVAFVDIAAGTERAGDADLHPVPWSALRLAAAPAASTPVTLALAKTKDELAAAPNLLQVLIQDPLYRTKVYACYGVPPPPYERS